MSSVLDTSAIVAMIFREPGHEVVAECLAAGALISTVNIAEMVAVCMRAGFPGPLLRRTVEHLPARAVDADTDLALRAGEMVAVTKPFGLSLGDRFCLALALREGVPAYTADTAWTQVAAPLGVTVNLIR